LCHRGRQQARILGCGEEAGRQGCIIESRIDLFEIDADCRIGTKSEDRPVAGMGKIKLQGIASQRRLAVNAISEVKSSRIATPIKAKNLAQAAAADDKVLCFTGIKETRGTLQFIGRKEFSEKNKL
jgi:hypothetical protein